jgi:hypothetical protein
VYSMGGETGLVPHMMKGRDLSVRVSISVSSAGGEARFLKD